jgi:general secretion pathway protein N
MKIPWRLIGFGVAAYLVFLVVTLPADFVLSRLRASGIAASGITGSIWNGKAAAFQFGNVSLGATSWNVDFLPLFAGRLSGDVRATRDDGAAKAHVSIRFGGRVDVHALDANLPIHALGGMGLPGGWQGSVRLQLAEMRLEKNWPVRIVGSVDALNLVGPANQPTALGNFHVDFNGDAPKNEEGVTGNVTSVGDGPLDVSGTLQLQPNRTYLINAQVGTRPTAPASIAKALQYLGPPDAQGRRPMSISATL